MYVCMYVCMCRCSRTDAALLCCSFTCSGSGDDSTEVPEVAEMPVDLDIEVEAVALDEHDKEHLRLDTKYALALALASPAPAPALAPALECAQVYVHLARMCCSPKFLVFFSFR